MKNYNFTIETECWITNEERNSLLENVDEEKVTEFAFDNRLDFDSALLVLSGRNTLEEVKERAQKERDAYLALCERLELEGCSEVIVDSEDGVYKITATPVDEDYIYEACNECENVKISKSTTPRLKSWVFSQGYDK